MRIVTQQDLEPDGWRCEACERDFEVGQEAIGSILAFSGRTPRDFEEMMSPEQRAAVEAWDESIPVFGDWRCRECFDAGREVQ